MQGSATADTAQKAVAAKQLDRPKPKQNKNATLKKLRHLTGTSWNSYSSWDNMRQNRRLDKYGFDWSTDGCSHAPDKPDGFNFYWACWRHDFGYRNHKKLVGKAEFKARYKSRVDSAFHQDMLRVCMFLPIKGPIYRKCKGYAKTYYETVKKLGA
ncbi:phospholipase [Nonomuraea sp. B19D2]|uniref:phospholipase n=1 Tax=Nonomuraea sp. B19D2 TaxID=3159561 RepID=UPI0032D9F909